MRQKIFVDRIVQILILLIVASGCQSEPVSQEESVRDVQLLLCPAEMDVLSMTTRSIQHDVDEGTASDYVVKDFWLFEYDNEGNLIGVPRYYLSEEFQNGQYVSMFIPDSHGKEFKMVVLANTHNPDLLSSLIFNTFDNLKSSYIEVDSLSDLYQQSGDSYDLLMNGIVPLYWNTTSVDCKLYRNVAKLELKLVNGQDSGIILQSVQLRNVPDRFFLADQSYSDEICFPDTDVSGFRSLDKDIVDISSGLESQLLTYYLPRNMQGKNLSTAETDKNINAPENATYLEVVAVRNSSDDDVPVIYRFYLGENDIDDFNICPNNLYRWEIDFEKVGSQDDSRVDDRSEVLLEESNSYLINPSPGRVKYTVPIDNRINTYWSSQSGMKKPDWQNYLVNSEKEWVAEIIWQDVQTSQIRFIDEGGNLTDKYIGRRDDRFFSFVLAEGAVVGNVVVGVRRADEAGRQWTASDGYMWSWHIWITDYNPYEEVGEWQDGKYIYDLSAGNGSLHRYPSLDNLPMYENRYVMDRNLGAKGYRKSDGYEASTGLIYQFGRKDPFPTGDSVVRFPDGTVRVTKQSGEGIYIYNSVISPLTYYYKDGDWTVEDTYDLYSWNDLIRETVNGHGKSFFDPCPPGWQLPDYMIWNGLDSADRTDWTGGSSNAGWMIDLNASAEDEESAYFPASGMRNRNNGNYTDKGGVGAMWSASVSAGTKKVIYLYYDSTRVLPKQNAPYRAMGLPVRCITERGHR